jgi:prevent-host-death family protein
MTALTQRQLRNDSAAVMDRVERGEVFTVTRNGRKVAVLSPIGKPRRGVPRKDLLAAFADLPPLSLAELREDGDAFFADGGDKVG